MSFHTGGIKAIYFSPNGDKLLTIGDTNFDSSICVWHVDSGEILVAGEAPSKFFSARWISDAIHFISLGEEFAYEWLLGENNQLLTRKIDLDLSLFGNLNAQDTTPIHLTFLDVVKTDDQTIIWISSNKGSFVAFKSEIPNSPLLSIRFIHNTSISMFQWRCNGTILISSSGSELKQGRLHIMHPFSDSHFEPLNIMSFDGSIISMDFEENGEEGIVGTSVGSIWFVNWKKGKCVRMITSHTTDINAICLSDRIGIVSTASNDGSIRIWSTETEQNNPEGNFSVPSLHHAIQFQVNNVAATCVVIGSLALSCIAGYSNGTIISHDLGKAVSTKHVTHKSAIMHLLLSMDGLLQLLTIVFSH